MKIENWSRIEQDTLTGYIRTEFKIVTFESIGDSSDFLEYIKAYDKDLDIAKMKTVYERDVQAHDFWRGYSMEGILEVLDSIFLTDDKTAIECKANVRLKTKISSDKINAGIQILRDHYGIFYKPEPKPLQPVIDEVSKWNSETGLEKIPPEGKMVGCVFRSPKDE